MLKLVRQISHPNLFDVFALQVGEDTTALIECVGAFDPSESPRDKIVFVVSTQFGCPIGCSMCDASRNFRGNLTSEELLAQVQYLAQHWAGSLTTDCPKLKVQFARMGEPALNDNVIDALERLPSLLPTKGLMPCIATVAPRGRETWFERLLQTKKSHYSRGKFQLQFSIQTTDLQARAKMIPAKIWSFQQIAHYAEKFVEQSDRKVVLNFALAEGLSIDPSVVAGVFSPSTCIVKLTPLNPTSASVRAGLQSSFCPVSPEKGNELAERFRCLGFDCIVSMGLAIESEMGTSCGQLAILSARNERRLSEDSSSFLSG